MTEQTPPPSSLPAPPGTSTDSITPGSGTLPDVLPPERDRRLSRFGVRGLQLRRHAARGTIINAGFTIGIGVISLLKGFLLAVFLTRADFGVWGVLVAALGTLTLLKNVGIGDKYVQQEEEDQELAFQKAFTLEVIVNGTLFLFLVTAVPVMAWAYDEPKLLLPGFVAILNLPAGVLQMPITVHYRRMEFLRQRLLLSIDPVVGLIASLALAAAGAGYWALVGGVLVGSWSAAAVAIWQSPYPLRLRYDSGTLRSYLGFSWPLFVATLGGVVIMQESAFLAHSVLGLAGVGAITLAATVSQLTERVDTLITDTLYPAICAVRDRTDLLYESFVKSNRLALMWSMPYGFAITLFASDVVAFGIGEQWRPAVVLLQAYGVTAAFSGVAFNWDAYFRAVGNTKPMAVAGMAAMVTFVATSIPLTIAHGLTGFAIAVGAQALAHMACRALYLSRFFHGFHYLGHAARSIAPTLPAIAGVLAVRGLITADRTLALALSELAIYGLLIVGFTALFEGRLVKEAVSYLRAAPAIESGR